MNATYSIDHVEAVTHVSNVLATATAGVPAVNKPKTSVTSHYDPLGSELATVSTTSFDNVTFGADGKITGGTLGHQSLTPEGNKLSTTSIAFQSDGKPASADIQIHNIHSDGDFKKVSMDMTSAKWTNSLSISSGAVKVTAFDGTTQAKTHDGSITFDKESLVSGSFTHYAHETDGSINGYSEIDYSKLKFLGTSIVGGQYTLNSHNADKSLTASSLVSVSPVGRLQNIETTNMDAANVKNKVMIDFSAVQFNARNQFHVGDVNFAVQDDKGAKLSETKVSYQNAVPANAQTLVYDGADVSQKIMVDYSQSQFNNKNKVVASTKKVDIYSPDGKLLSSTVVAYDEHGIKLTPGSPDPKALAPKAPPLKITPPPAPAPLTPSPMAAVVRHEPSSGKRDDGSLEWQRDLSIVDDKPILSTTTYFGVDGTTVIKTLETDMSKIVYDPGSNTVNGDISMHSKLGGNVLKASSTVSF